MAYESLRAMGIFLLKIIGFNKMESGKCVHILNSDLVDRARVYAKSKNMTLKHFVEGLIYENTHSVPTPPLCKVCNYPQWFDMYDWKAVKNCPIFRRYGL